MSKLSLGSLFSATAIYAIANLMQRGMSLILLPIYARYFTKAEFGAMDLIYQGIMVLIILCSVGMPQGIPRGIYHGDNTEADNRKMLGVLSVFLVLSSILVFLLIWYFNSTLNELLFKGEGKNEWLQLSAVFFISLAIQQYPLNILKAYQRSVEYSLWSIATFFIAMLGNIYLIIFQNLGLSGMLVANSLGFGLIGLIAFFRCLRLMDFNIEWYRLKPLLEFGLPMLPALLGRKILEVSDRFMLPQYHSMEVLGDYVMGTKMANIIEIIVLVPFLFAWQPFFYSISKKPEAPLLFSRITLYFIGLSCFIFMSMYVLHGSILSIIAGDNFNTSSLVILLLTGAVLANGIQYTISPGIHIKNKLPQEMALMLVAALINLILNLILIPAYGAKGAALATLVSYLLYLLCTFILSQRAYPIDYPVYRIIKVILIALFSFFLLYLFQSIFVGLLIAFIFIAVGPFLDWYSHDFSGKKFIFKVFKK